MNGPGVAFECPEKNGHISGRMPIWWRSSTLTRLKSVAPGEMGELVITTLQREAMPIIRYRTKDLTSIIEGPCACGRTHARITRITGRSDDMLILKGVEMFPMQIEAVLIGIAGISRTCPDHP